MLNNGIDALKHGNLELAEGCLNQAIEIKNDLIPAYLNLMYLYLHQGRHDDIKEIYLKVVEIAPDTEDMYGFFGQSLISQHKLDQAKDVFKEAIAITPDSPSAYCNLGYILRHQGKKDEAVPYLEKAIELKPDYIDAHKLLADVKAYSGGDDSHIKLMEKLLEEGGQELRETTGLHFMLGDAYGRFGDYKNSFINYKAGNSLAKTESGYDFNSSEGRFFKNWRDIGNRSFLERHRDSGISGFSPIFVVGVPRSGTSLVEQILSTHSEVYGAGELPYMTEVLGLCPVSHANAVSGDVWSYAEIRKMAEYYKAKLDSLPTDKLHIVDKQPDNFIYLPLIKVMFPDAKIIHCKRDPMDTCFSIYKKFFSYGNVNYSYDFNDIALFYNNYKAMMEHYHGLLPDFVLDIQYEDVVENLEGNVRKILNFCGLPWEEQCLSFHKTERFVQTASSLQVKQPLYNSSVGAWKHYEEHLEPLKKALTGEAV